jgi:Xaa-Pro aminopeptidase
VTPAAEIERRIGRLREGLVRAGLDAAVIVQHADLAYFSGTNQQAHLVVPARGEPVLLVRRVLERAQRESAIGRIAPLRSLSSLGDELAAARVGAGARVGFELDVLPARAYLGYARRLPGLELADCSDVVRAVRAVKSPWDLERMRAACEQVRRGAEAVPALIGAGVNEADVQLEVERVMRKAGHQGQLRFRGFNQEMHYGQILGGPSGAVAGYSDSPLCGPGPNAAVGKGPDRHVLAPGDTVIADLVGGHEGWLSDQTRTFAVGTPPADMVAAYDTAVAILRAVEERLAPGAVPSVLFALSEQMAAAAGLAEHFMGAGAERVRFLGHGVGMEIDELPILAPGFDEPLVEGNVVAIEPKFVFPGRGAVGIENMYAVTTGGHETMTTAPEELIVR